MPKLIATNTLLDHELSELRLLVERQTGIVLDCPNSALAAHVNDYIESQELGSAAALLERLRSSDQDFSIFPSLLDGLIITKSGFFRHHGALNALAKQVVPQLCTRKSGEGLSPLRIWSAGCSTGEETYSIAMAVCDALSQASAAGSSLNGKSTVRNGGIAESAPVIPPSLGAALSVHIVGSDLLPRNIEVADRGVYPQSALNGLPPASIRNYFSKISSPVVASETGQNEVAGDAGPEAESRSRRAAKTELSDAASANAAHLLVKPRLRSLVTFNCMNLARPSYIGRFDCIFCMDVLPHFSRAQRIALVERLHLYLEPGGYLFLSQTEKLLAPNLNFRSETFDGYTFHRKPLAASAAYGR
jgi:chemotaxis methyl-accepting protein methylase